MFMANPLLFLVFHRSLEFKKPSVKFVGLASRKPVTDVSRLMLICFKDHQENVI
jgi:hypothetical protein